MRDFNHSSALEAARCRSFSRLIQINIPLPYIWHRDESPRVSLTCTCRSSAWRALHPQSDRDEVKTLSQEQPVRDHTWKILAANGMPRVCALYLFIYNKVPPSPPLPPHRVLMASFNLAFGFNYSAQSLSGERQYCISAHYVKRLKWLTVSQIYLLLATYFQVCGPGSS